MRKKFTLDPDRPIKVEKNLPKGVASFLPSEITDEDGRRIFFMGEALALARTAFLNGDIPVGCVVVRHNEIIAAAYNKREADKIATSHAEISAINEACRALGGWRLVSCELFVTLEPCAMCAGAIMNARVPKVYIGAPEPKSGAYGGLFDLNSLSVNHKPQVTFGIMADECSNLMTEFFDKRRNPDG